MNESDYTRKFLNELIKQRKEDNTKIFTHKVSEQFSAGFPDAIMAERGVVRFLEFKMGKTAKISPLQAKTLLELAQVGAHAYVVYFYPRPRGCDWRAEKVGVDHAGMAVLTQVANPFFLRDGYFKNFLR